jgi:hypothetical protein
MNFSIEMETSLRVGTIKLVANDLTDAELEQAVKAMVKAIDVATTSEDTHEPA